MCVGRNEEIKSQQEREKEEERAEKHLMTQTHKRHEEKSNVINVIDTTRLGYPTVITVTGMTAEIPRTKTSSSSLALFIILCVILKTNT